MFQVSICIYQKVTFFTLLDTIPLKILEFEIWRNKVFSKAFYQIKRIIWEPK